MEQPSLNLRCAFTVAIFEIDKLVRSGDESHEVEFTNVCLFRRQHG